MTTPPLVLVPALGADERLWQPVIDLLGDRVDTVVIRGEGDSMSTMADDILAAAPPEFALAGISMGGYVALESALRRTGRIRGLALLNTSAISAPENRRQNSLDLIALIDSGAFDQAAGIVSRAVAPHRSDVREIADAMTRTLGPQALKDQQVAVLHRRDRSDELATIDVPSLVVVGTADTITPPSLGEALASGIPDAELVTLEGVGHFSTIEDPAGVADAIATWLKRIEE